MKSDAINLRGQNPDQSKKNKKKIGVLDFVISLCWREVVLTLKKGEKIFLFVCFCYIFGFLFRSPLHVGYLNINKND
jgi:hypothetical protein